MSREMWSFDEDGEIFYEKTVNGFLPELFSSWKALGTNHVVSIVLFARIQLDGVDFPEDGPPIFMDMHGRPCRDFYKVAIDWETRQDWSQILLALKREFIQFQSSVLQHQTKDGSTVIAGNLSPASEGNLLEAVNLALNPFDRHYVDRDLMRTGLSIVVITPGVGLYQVDKALCRLTWQRMIDNGIGLDFVCLSKPPLHAVPLFQFTSRQPNHPYEFSNESWSQLDSKLVFKKESPANSLSVKPESYEKTVSEMNAGRASDAKFDLWDPLYLDDDKFQSSPTFTISTVPNWIECSFWSRSNSMGPFVIPSKDVFVPRCKLHEVQHMGVGEKIGSVICLPFLNEHRGLESSLDYEVYDKLVFRRFGRDDMTDLNATPRLHPSSFTSDPFGKADPSLKFDLESFRSNNMSEPFVAQSEEKMWLAAGHDSRRLKESASNVSLPLSVHEDDEVRRDKFYRPFDDDDQVGQLSSSLKPIRIRRPGSSKRYNSESIPDHSDTYQARSYTGLSSSPMTEYSRTTRGSPGKSWTQVAPRHPVRLNYVNPCNPIKNMARTSGQAKRWEHLVPRYMLPSQAESYTNWKSLCTPACLPLTTDFFPTAEELLELYQEYTYTVSPSEESNPYQDSQGQRVESLLIELISQRLAQGFQLIVSNVAKPISVAPVPGSEIPTTSEKKLKSVGQSSTELFQTPGEFSDATPYFLCLGDHVHRLFYDSSGNNVEIKRYIRKKSYATDPSSYACSIWPKHDNGYLPKSLVFSYPPLSNYNWNYLDHLISGYQDEMTDALRFWKTRFILIPSEAAPQTSSLFIPGNEILDEEEVRLVGFNKFIELFDKAKWNPDHELKSVKKTRSVFVHHTTSTLSSFLISESQKLDGPGSPPPLRETLFSPAMAFSGSIEKLSTNSSMQSLGLALQSPTGVNIRDRRWHVRLYEQVFVGEQCVDWFIRNITEIESREEAVEFGNRLLDRGLIQHAHLRHRFMDGFYFYRIHKDYSIEKSKRVTTPSSWFGKSSSKPVLDQSEPVLQHAGSQDSANFKDTPFELTKSLILDLDPLRKSTRREMAMLHWDTVQNPKFCYHFQLHWLVCTPRLIDEMLQTWTRMADKCGLKLIEAPVNQVQGLGDDNPFSSVIPINLIISPPKMTELSANTKDSIGSTCIYCSELLKSFNFVLDVESDEAFTSPVSYSFNRVPYKYTQYVHRSGMAFIQIRQCGSFIWVNNRLHLANVQGKFTNESSATPVEALMMQFQSFCNDARQLESFFTTTSANCASS